MDLITSKEDAGVEPGLNNDGKGKHSSLRAFSATFILLAALLPQLLNFFLAFDVANFIDGFDKGSCYCFKFVESFPESKGKAFVVLSDHSDACMYENATQAAFVKGSDYSSVLQNIMNGYNTNVDQCVQGVAAANWYSQTVVEINAIFTALIVLVFCPMMFLNVRPYFAAIAISFFTVGSEYATLVVLLSSVGDQNKVAGGAIRDSGSVFFLLVGVLASTIFAFILNLFGEGDAEILDKAGLQRKSKLRMFCLFCLQGLYAVSICLNILMMVQHPPRAISF